MPVNLRKGHRSHMCSSVGFGHHCHLHPTPMVGDGTSLDLTVGNLAPPQGSSFKILPISVLQSLVMSPIKFTYICTSASHSRGWQEAWYNCHNPKILNVRSLINWDKPSENHNEWQHFSRKPVLCDSDVVLTPWGFTHSFLSFRVSIPNLKIATSKGKQIPRMEMHFSLPGGQTAELQVLRKPKSVLSSSATPWKITAMFALKKNKHLKYTPSPSSLYVPLCLYFHLPEGKPCWQFSQLFQPPEKAPASSVESACHAVHIYSV